MSESKLHRSGMIMESMKKSESGSQTYSMDLIHKSLQYGNEIVIFPVAFCKNKKAFNECREQLPYLSVKSCHL